MRTKRRRKRESPLAGTFDMDASEETHTHSSNALGPEEQFSEAESRRILAECFAHLPQVDRETLERAYFEETDGPKDSAFRKRKERALQRLRLLWNALYGGAS